MSLDGKPLHESLIDWFAYLGVWLRAALSTTAEPVDANAETDHSIDPDFEGWLRGDPSVTNNAASRYGNRKPGYITGNGLGSMEIGATDD